MSYLVLLGGLVGCVLVILVSVFFKWRWLKPLAVAAGAVALLGKAHPIRPLRPIGHHQPKPQQMALSIRFRMIDIVGSGVEHEPVVEKLNIALAKVHIEIDVRP